VTNAGIVRPVQRRMGCINCKEVPDSEPDDEGVIKWKNPALDGSSDEESEDESYADRSKRLKAERSKERAAKRKQEQAARPAAQRPTDSSEEDEEEEEEEEADVKSTPAVQKRDIPRSTPDMDFEAALGSYADKNAAVGEVVVGDMLRSIAKCAIKKTADRTSEKVASLPVGSVIDVLEVITNDEGQLRVRCEMGWASTTSQTGKLLMERVMETEPESEVDRFEGEEEEAAEEGKNRGRLAGMTMALPGAGMTAKGLKAIPGSSLAGKSMSKMTNATMGATKTAAINPLLLMGKSGMKGARGTRHKMKGSGYNTRKSEAELGPDMSEVEGTQRKSHLARKKFSGSRGSTAR
jgi:hypothetical protein